MWKKLTFVVPVLLVLGGCATNPIAAIAETVTGLPSGVLTKSVANPVTRDTLYRVENGLRVAVAGLQTYKNYCEDRPVGDRCDAVVAQLQSYSKRARPLVRQLRVFVRKNDQVNAITVFGTLRAIWEDFRITAAQEGISVPNIGG
jgi:hypothetical protein